MFVVAFLVFSIPGCGSDATETGSGPDGDRPDTALHGLWKVDWEKTVDALTDKDDRERATAKIKAVVGDFEMEFASETVRIRILGKDTESPWSVGTREDDVWRIRGRHSDLTLEWIDDDSLRLHQDQAADGTMRGLVFARQ